MRLGLSLPLSLALAGLVFGCSSSLETFRCETNADCTSEDQRGGVCESTQVCSFADSECAGGQRYGPASGEQSNDCVEGAGTPDAANSNTLPDAGPNRPDANVVVATDAGPDAAPVCATLLSIVVYDDQPSDDHVRVREDGNEVLLCVPEASGVASAVATCEYCMMGGVEIELKAESGIHLTSLMTDCDSGCTDDSSCKFTATTSCSAFYIFDDAMTP